MSEYHFSRTRSAPKNEKFFRISSANFDFPEKYELSDHPLYDGLIEEWAQKTGRKSRPNHAG